MSMKILSTVATTLRKMQGVYDFRIDSTLRSHKNGKLYWILQGKTRSNFQENIIRYREILIRYRGRSMGIWSIK